MKRPKRRKRSMLHDTEDLVHLKKHLNIKLSPKNSFLDPQFLLLKRWSNGTEAGLDLHNDEELDLCYFRSDHAALYVCEDVVRIFPSERFLLQSKIVVVVLIKPEAKVSLIRALSLIKSYRQMKLVFDF